MLFVESDLANRTQGAVVPVLFLLPNQIDIAMGLLQFRLRSVFLFLVSTALVALLVTTLFRLRTLQQLLNQSQIELQTERSRMGRFRNEYEVHGECLTNAPDHWILSISTRTYCPHELCINVDSIRCTEPSHYDSSRGMHCSRIVLTGYETSDEIRISVDSFGFSAVFTEVKNRSERIDQVFQGWATSGVVDSDNDGKSEEVNLFNWQQSHRLNIDFTLSEIKGVRPLKGN